MRFKRAVIITVALVAGMLLVGAVVLTIAPMEVTVDGRGVVKPVEYSLITPIVGGLVVKKHKKSGQMVKEGEVLAVLDSTDAESQLNNAFEEVKIREQKLEDLKAITVRAAESVKVAEARLKQAKVTLDDLQATSPEKQIANAAETVRQKEIGLKQKKKELTDTEELCKKGLVSTLDLERARAQSLIAESDLKMARNRLEMLRESLERDRKAAHADVQRWESELRLSKLQQDRSAEEKSLRSELNKARLQVGTLKRLIDAHTYRSPRTGLLLDFDVWEKQIVQVAYGGGTSVGRVIDNRNFKFETYVRQVDAPWVKRGCKVYIELDPYPHRKYDYFTGVVDKIGDETDFGNSEDQTTALVEVEILIVNPKWELRPGFGGYAEIVTDDARIIEWLLGLHEPEPPKPKTMEDGESRSPAEAGAASPAPATPDEPEAPGPG